MSLTLSTASVPRTGVLSTDVDLRDAKARTALAADLRRLLVADTAPDRQVLNYCAFFARMREAARSARGIGLIGYSRSNLFLLALQEQTFGEVHRGLYAGATQWSRLGRDVKPDARPKLIWAPLPARKVTTATVDDDGNDTETTVVVPRRHAFRLVPVFDFTDTSGDETPDWATPLDVGSSLLFDALMETSPVPVHVLDLTGVGRHYQVTDHRLTVDGAQAPGNQLQSLVQALAAHHLGHTVRVAAGDEERDACQQEAALAGLLAMQAFGLGDEVGNDLTASALAGLRTWTTDGVPVDGHKARVELLTERLEAAWDAVATLLDRVEQRLS